MTKIIYFAFGLAVAVVILGAYVRLSDAGLACPDWPGCFGKMVVSHPSGRAWKEMIHRYLAGTLGILILFIFLHALLKRKKVILPFVLLGLVIFQALLGMWTVTLRLHPTIVMAHLLGGWTTVGLLWWRVLDNCVGARHAVPLQCSQPIPVAVKVWFGIGLILLIVQIMLGGWTSANYAVFSCPTFPACQGSLWPPMDFKEAFHFFRTMGPNYEFGLLHPEARVAIHMIHRWMAVFVVLFWGIGAIFGLKVFSQRSLRNLLILLCILLVAQFFLGVLNAIWMRPMIVAMLHHVVALLLLLCTLSLLRFLYPITPSRPPL